jgi:peptide/nickel transport system permease protein
MTRFWNVRDNADAIFATFLLIAVLALCVLVPLLWPIDPVRGTLTATFKPPLSVIGGELHPLGTDQLGRDLLARLGLGTAISLSIVLAASVISVVLGTTLGMIAGYYRGWFDIIIMRAVDVQLAIPFILLILLIVAVIGPSMGNLVVVLGVTGWAVFGPRRPRQDARNPRAGIYRRLALHRPVQHGHHLPPCPAQHCRADHGADDARPAAPHHS